MQEYLSGTAKAWRLNATGHFGACFIPLELGADTFYGLDADTMLAITHAVEDLALEAAEGQLLVSFQDLRFFNDHRERYWQLAATLEGVRVMGGGRLPQPEPGIQFLKINQPGLNRFWIVLYQGRQAAILLIGRQVNDTAFIPDKRFLGSYTFDRRVIERIHANLEAVIAGRNPGLHEFDRLHALDLAARRLEGGFRREQAAVVGALRRLRRDGARQIPRYFVAQLDLALRRLCKLKEQVSTLIS
jgi:hypothetical protein